MGDLATSLNLGEPGSVPQQLALEYIRQLTLLATMRWNKLGKLIRICESSPSHLHPLSVFQNEIAFCARLIAEMEVSAEPQAFIELYALFFCILLANRHSQTEALTRQYFNIYKHPKARIPKREDSLFEMVHLVQRLRLATQMYAVRYSHVARNDRTQLRHVSQEPGSAILVWGGARPFLGISKFLPPGVDLSLVEAAMGEVKAADWLLHSSVADLGSSRPSLTASCLESAWLVRLLHSLLAVVKDGEDELSPLSSAALLSLAVVLMSQAGSSPLPTLQVFPDKLQETASELVSMVSFGKVLLPPSPSTYRHFLLLRLLSVILAKGVDHFETKRRKRDESEEVSRHSVTVLKNICDE